MSQGSSQSERILTTSPGTSLLLSRVTHDPLRFTSHVVFCLVSAAMVCWFLRLMTILAVPEMRTTAARQAPTTK